MIRVSRQADILVYSVMSLNSSLGWPTIQHRPKPHSHHFVDNQSHCRGVAGSIENAPFGIDGRTVGYDR